MLFAFKISNLPHDVFWYFISYFLLNTRKYFLSLILYDFAADMMPCIQHHLSPEDVNLDDVVPDDVMPDDVVPDVVGPYDVMLDDVPDSFVPPGVLECFNTC